MKRLFVLTVFIAACGHSGGTLDPGAGNDGGAGTKTLSVIGSARAQAQLTNAMSFGEFTTDFAVQITLAGQPVTTGTVTMTSTSGVVTLAVDPQNHQWVATAPSYDEAYVIELPS